MFFRAIVAVCRGIVLLTVVLPFEEERRRNSRLFAWKSELDGLPARFVLLAKTHTQFHRGRTSAAY